MESTCGVCLQDNIRSAPSIWCPQCEELLCQTCSNYHKRAKCSREHQVIPYEDYQKLPPFIVNTKVYCMEHKEKISEFCRMHDKPICVKCHEKNHKKCQDVVKIDDIVKDVKTSVAFEDALTEMESICGTLSNIATHCNQNLQELKNKRQNIQKSLEQKIDNIINHLKKLKVNMLSKFDTSSSEITKDISKVSLIAQTKEKILRSILNQADAIRKFASNYQTFIGIKEMEKLVHETDTMINKLNNSKKLKHYDMKIDLDNTLEDVVCRIKSLGEITVTKSPLPDSLHISKPTEGQKEVQGPVTLQLKQKITLDGNCSINGCCILPSGVIIVLTDCESFKVWIYKSDGTLKSSIEFTEDEDVQGITGIDDHQVAVSHNEPESISIINIDKGKVVRSLSLEEHMFVGGMCCMGRDIFGCVIYRGLVKVNIDSEKAEYVVKSDRFTYDSQVTACKDLICYTCSGLTNTVTVMDSKFNVLLTYNNEEILYGPNGTGVTIDEHRNIYVTARFTKNLVVISPDGKSWHQLLRKEDGITCPSAVHYEPSSRKMIIVNEEGPALVYSVK